MKRKSASVSILLFVYIIYHPRYTPIYTTIITCHVICINNFAFVDEAKLDPTETKPLLCKALRDIGETCTATITKCFSQEDTDQMRYQHVQTMGKVP